MGRALRDAARPARREPHRYGAVVTALAPGAGVEDRADALDEGLGRGGDGTAAQQHLVDVQQPGEVRGARAQHPCRLREVPAGDGGQAQGLYATPGAAGAGRPVELDDLVPELPGAGPGPPVHAAAEDEPGAESRTEVQIREGPGPGAAAGLLVPRAADRQAERRRVGVLVDDDRHAQPPLQRVPQRVAVPLREAGDAVQHTADMVERPGKGGPEPEEGGSGGESTARRPSARILRDGRRQPLRRELLRRPRHPFQQGLRARAQVQRGAPLRHHGAVEVDQHRTQLVAVQVDAEGVARPGHQAQHRARLAAGGRAASGLGGQALAPEPGGDLADRLRGEPRALGELQPADPPGTGAAQQVEHQGGVVAAQGEQIGAALAGPRARPRASADRPVHTPIVSGACTLATPLRK